MDTYDRIEALMKSRGMSATELSRASGISTGLLSQWKRRMQQPSAAKLQLAAKALGVSVEELLGGEPAPAASTQAERRLLLLNRRAADLPPEEYEKLLKNFEDTIDLYLRACGLQTGEK